MILSYSRANNNYNPVELIEQSQNFESWKLKKVFKKVFSKFFWKDDSVLDETISDQKIDRLKFKNFVEILFFFVKETIFDRSTICPTAIVQKKIESYFGIPFFT